MPLSRRDFLKLSGMTAAGAFVGGTAFLSGCKSADKLSGTKESTTICPYCCVGCGACVNECVYKVSHVLGEDMKKYGLEEIIRKDKSYKCHACMQNKRKVPLCAQHCPTGALSYGDRDTLVRKGQVRVKQVIADYPHASLYGIDQFGGLRVLTVLKDSPEKYGLPLQPKAIDMRRAEAIRDTYQLLALFTMGFPTLKRVAYKISRSMQG